MTAHLASSTLNPMHDSIVAEAKKLANKMILKPQTSTPLKIPTNFLANQGEQMVKQEAQDSQKSTRFLSNRAVSLLNKWFIENRDYPYPDEPTTDYLANEAEISVKQVKKWFANKRVRSQLCCKPIHRNRKSKNSSQLNESIKYSRQLEVAENIQTNESYYPFLRLPSQQNYQQQHQQSIQQLPPNSLLQPAIGFAHRMSCQMPVQPSLSLMRPLNSCVPNSTASPLYGQLMLMNLIATQRHAQMQSLNLLSKLSNQSSSTTSASISSAVSNSSANSNEDYLNDLQEEDEGELKEENEEREDQEEEEEIVDVDESNDYRQNGNKHNDQNQNFYSMLMMINPNYIKREQNQDNDDHISAISPPPSGTSMYTTSSSSVPYISSSSSSCSSSSNSSKNTTPNTDSNKYYAAGMYTEKDHYLSNDESSEKEQKYTRESGEKKINFAIISTLVD